MLGIVFRGRVCPGRLFEAMPGLEALTHRARGVTFGVVPLLLALALAVVFATPVAGAAVRLFSPSVSPTSGTASTVITFAVTYRDADGRPAPLGPGPRRVAEPDDDQRRDDQPGRRHPVHDQHDAWPSARTPSTFRTIGMDWV